jgi:hypothetical protein
MKTGHHWWYAQFLRYNSLEDEEIIICEDYYDLHQHNISKFDRRIALICGQHDSKLNSTEYKNDLDLRIAKLKEKGFKFILAHPWECAETAKDNEHIKLFSDSSVGTWYGGSNWFWFYMYEKHHNKSFTFDHSVKKYDFLYLNKQKRVHRVSLYNELQTERCLDNSLYSFIGLEKPIRLDPAYELPWIDTNNYPWVGRDQDMYELPYNHSAYNIVSETHDTGDTFITEKIWKPVIMQQMFVVHSTPHYLKTLRGLGFQTFHSVLDESYDEEQNAGKRIDKIVELCKWLKDQDPVKMYKATESIRKHNAEHFFKESAVKSAVNATVLGLLKFFDSSQISS